MDNKRTKKTIIQHYAYVQAENTSQGWRRGGRGGGARDKVIECCYIITAGFVGLLFDCV